MAELVPKLLKPLLAGGRYRFFQGQLLTEGLQKNYGLSFEGEEQLRTPPSAATPAIQK
jgi:hypothetical protein